MTIFLFVLFKLSFYLNNILNLTSKALCDYLIVNNLIGDFPWEKAG